VEAIGGTGDTLTGLLSIFCSLDCGRAQSSIIAAKTNRWMGYNANPCPATQISELIENIPRALSTVFGQMNLKTTILCNFSDIDLRIEICDKGLSMISIIAIKYIKAIYSVKMMFPGIGCKKNL